MSEEVAQEENLSEEQIIENAISKEEVDEAVEQNEQGNADPLEAIARKHGWKPESEWKGNPPKDGFKSAEDFVESTFDIQHRQAEKIDRIEQNLNKIVEGEAKRMKSALEAQEKRLLQQQMEAVETADTEAFKEIEQELTRTRKEMQSVEKEDDEVLSKEKAFIERNPWYGQDKVMTADIDAVSKSINTANMSVDEYFETLEEIAKARYPHKFVNENRQRSAAVAGDSPRNKKGNSKNFDALPPEAQEAWAEINLVTKLSKEDYAKSYFGE